MQEKLCDIKLYGTTNIWPKWQIVIPKEIRDKLNINPGDSMTILLKNDKYIGLVKNQDVNELIEFINSMKNK